MEFKGTNNSENKEEESKPDPNSNESKNSIYIIGGEKGGVGKSFICRCLIEYFIKKGWENSFTLIDADPTIDDVSSIFSSISQKVIFSDDKFQFDNPRLIFSEAELKAVVVNLPSNVCRQFDAWINGSGMLEPEVREEFGEIIYFFVSDGCYRSAKQFVEQVETYSAERIRHVLVLNPGRLTQASNFTYLEEDEDKLLTNAIKKHNVPVMLAPELASNLQYDSDKNNLTYEQLQDKQTNLYQKHKVKTFLKNVNLFFDQIFASDINQPNGLDNLIKEQKTNREKLKLPILSKSELMKKKTKVK